MQDGVHTAGINRLNWMIVGKLPLLPTSQIADLSASPSPLVTGSQTAAVFGMSCINGEKPPAADGAFLGCMAHTKSLKQIGTEHPHKGDIVHPLDQLRLRLSGPNGGYILHRSIGQSHPGRVIQRQSWLTFEELSEHCRITVRGTVIAWFIQLLCKFRQGFLVLPQRITQMPQYLRYSYEYGCFAVLTKTNYVKSIVTAELRMDLERKKEQSYQGLLYVRFLCFGNGALTALHDRSDGFFRRQIILTTKDKPADRFDDPFLAEKLIAEKEGIFLWMLEGLRRLIANHYHFTISQRAKDNISSAVRDVNNILDFLDSEGYVAFKADYEASTKNLYAAYKRWCEDNAENPLSPKSFANQLSQNTKRYHLEPVNNLHIGGGKRCRGYMGIYILLSPMEL